MKSLENSTRKLLNNAKGSISREQIVGLAGWFRKNAPDDPFYMLFLKANGNHKKVIYDLRQKFPEIFSDYARFNESQNTKKTTVKATGTNSMIPESVFSENSKLSIAGFSNFIPILLLAAAAYYFLR